jgi:hypothetical protein
MSKKLCIGLAPLLAIAALVVMPVAAQAAPHYYVNGIRTSEAVSTPILGWGIVTIEPLGTPLRDVNSACEYSAGATVQNPGTGETGPAGRGAINNFSSWNCANANCPPGEVEVPAGSGKKYQREYTVNAEKLPWSQELIVEENKIRFNIAGLQLSLQCIAHGSKVSASGPGEHEPVVVSTRNPVVCVTTVGFFKLKPLFENGTQIGGPGTSRLIFDEPGDGELECKGPAGSEIEFRAAVTGVLKIFGFTKQQIISGVNP